MSLYLVHTVAWISDVLHLVWYIPDMIVAFFSTYISVYCARWMCKDTSKDRWQYLLEKYLLDILFWIFNLIVHNFY